MEQPAGQENGAEDGTRTRDPHLGKVMLYQLSHFRPLLCPIVPPHSRCGWCRGPGSNWRHLDFQSSALPTELPRLAGRRERPQEYRCGQPVATAHAPTGFESRTPRHCSRWVAAIRRRRDVASDSRDLSRAGSPEQRGCGQLVRTGSRCIARTQRERGRAESTSTDRDPRDGHRGGGATPMWPAMFWRARIRSPIGGWVSHSDFARSSNDLIGLTM